jgi:type I site-specific restriction endonuclease
VQFEVPVQGYDPTPWNGFTDFSLYYPDGGVLAVIEAKRMVRPPRDGEEQLRRSAYFFARRKGGKEAGSGNPNSDQCAVSEPTSTAPVFSRNACPTYAMVAASNCAGGVEGHDSMGAPLSRLIAP